MKLLAVIPARYASSRFPGKPLAMIGNRSMIKRVWEQVSKAEEVDRIVVASDDERIVQHVEAFGGEARLTSPTHASGTDRCAEVARQLQSEGYNFDWVINVQGDEPFFNPGNVRLLCEYLYEGDKEIVTLKNLISNAAHLTDNSIVKVVTDYAGFALYFSRFPIPFLREPISEARHYRHLGVYVFKPAVLQKICILPPSALELSESLEQLRWLENGFRIFVAETPYQGIGIDNPWDIDTFAGQYPIE